MDIILVNGFIESDHLRKKYAIRRDFHPLQTMDIVVCLMTERKYE